MSNIKERIKELSDDLEPKEDIFNEEDEFIMDLKRRLFSLGVEDRTIMLMYIELGSLRKVANELGVSHTLVYKKIKEIKGMLL